MTKDDRYKTRSCSNMLSSFERTSLINVGAALAAQKDNEEEFSGGNVGGGTPVPISNTAVKPS